MSEEFTLMNDLNNIDVCFMNTMSVKNKKVIKQKLPHGSID